MTALALSGTLPSATLNKPKSVIHAIRVQWKDASQDQIQKAIRAVETMNYPGLKNVQNPADQNAIAECYNQIIVMEFESEAALKNHADRPAQKQRHEVCPPIWEESRTRDSTN